MIFWNETRSLNLLFAMTTATDRTQLNSTLVLAGQRMFTTGIFRINNIE